MFSHFSFLLQAAVILNDILLSLKSMAHWMHDNDIQQVSITPMVGGWWQEVGGGVGGGGWGFGVVSHVKG